MQRAAGREGTTKAGGTEAGWVVPKRAGCVLPRRAGWVLPKQAGGFYRGGLLLMIVLSLALRPFCESYGDAIQCE